MQVRHILSGKGAEIVTARPDSTIAEAAKLLKDKNIGAIVVTTEDGGIAGILSERDIVRGLPDHGADLLTTQSVQRKSRDRRVSAKAVLKCRSRGSKNQYLLVHDRI